MHPPGEREDPRGSFSLSLSSCPGTGGRGSNGSGYSSVVVVVVVDAANYGESFRFRRQVFDHYYSRRQLAEELRLARRILSYLLV